MKRRMDVQAIGDILNRDNTAEVKRNKDGNVTVPVVTRKIVSTIQLFLFVSIKYNIRYYYKHSIKSLFTLKKALENTYYLSQIMCSFIVITGGIVAVWQYVLAKDVERKKIIVFEEDGVRRVQGVNVSRIYEEFINNTVMETLNNLEYFALHFVYDTADKYVVYQSLHVTYLEIVRLLYYNTARNNDTGEQKLFTNVIELFNIWKQMAEEQKQMEVQASGNSIIKGKSAKNIE